LQIPLSEVSIHNLLKMKKCYFSLFILLLVFYACQHTSKIDQAYVHHEQKNCVDVSLKKLDYKNYYLICITYKNNTNKNIFIPSGKYAFSFFKPSGIHKNASIIECIVSCSRLFYNNKYNTYIKEKVCECKDMTSNVYLSKKQKDSLYCMIKNTINDTVLNSIGKEISWQIDQDIDDLIFLRSNQIYTETYALTKKLLKEFYNYDFYIYFSYPNNYSLYNIRTVGYESYTFKYPPVINGYYLYDTLKCSDTVFFKY